MDGEQLVTLLIELEIGVLRRQENILQLETMTDGESLLGVRHTMLQRCTCVALTWASSAVTFVSRVIATSDSRGKVVTE